MRIDYMQQSSRCGLCGDRDEMINHIISKCSKLAQKEYFYMLDQSCTFTIKCKYMKKENKKKKGKTSSSIRLHMHQHEYVILTN